MKSRYLKIWASATMTVAIAAVVIRSLWQIVDIPTSGTLLIFVPLVIAMLGANTLFIYIVANPQRVKSLFFLIVITVAIATGLIAGVTHFVNFIISPLAEPFWSKVIAVCILTSGVSASILVLWLLWSHRKTRESHG
jgi:hypothetical protein